MAIWSKTRPAVSACRECTGSGVARATGGRFGCSDVSIACAGVVMRTRRRTSLWSRRGIHVGSSADLPRDRVDERCRATGAPDAGGHAGPLLRSLHRRVVHLGDVFPIDQVIHPGLEVVGPPVAIVDVVGMLPHVAAEDRLAAVHQWILAVGRLGDGDLAVLDREPAPARAELRDAGLDEVFLHLRDRAEIGDDLLLEIAGNLVAAAVGLHPLPEMDVVVVLAGIVEEPGILAEGTLHHVLERLSFPL